MPNYEALVDGKLRKIELTKTKPNTFTAKIDGNPRRIELETDKLEQSFTIKMDGKAYKVQLSKSEQEKPLPIKVEDVTFNVEVRTQNRKEALASFEPAFMAQARKVASSKQAVAVGAVTAPMTGKIVSVKVRKGDAVKANQVLCIIEAMKMENEIAAPKAGTVQEVNVQDGQPVNEGETLFIIA